MIPVKRSIVKVFKTRQKVKKYNPYHDDKGRFTNANGISVSSGSYSLPKNPSNLKTGVIPEGVKTFSGEGKRNITTSIGVVYNRGKVNNPQINDDSNIKDLENAFNKVLEHGKRTGTEGLLWLDSQYNEILKFETGSKNQVAISNEDIKYLKSLDKNSVISIHNHPRSSSFSSADMSIACILESVKEMRVIGHDGTKYCLEIGSGQRPDYYLLDEKYYSIKKTLESKYRKIFNKTGNAEETWKEHSHEINKKMADYFGWNYRRELNE